MSLFRTFLSKASTHAALRPFRALKKFASVADI